MCQDMAANLKNNQAIQTFIEKILCTQKNYKLQTFFTFAFLLHSIRNRIE